MAGSSAHREKPSAHPNIQVVNLKSDWKPFQIVPPAHASIVPYTGEKTFAMFEWWNHWPVTQVASSGISALAPDRASHSSLSHLLWDASAQTSNSVTRLMLAGMTNKPVTELLPLAKSWLSAPLITIVGRGFSSQGYYSRTSVRADSHVAPGPKCLNTPRRLVDSPLQNPAFIIRNWGDSPPTVALNGRQLSRGPSFRCGFIPHLEGDDLVMWLQLSSTSRDRNLAVADEALAGGRHSGSLPPASGPIPATVLFPLSTDDHNQIARIARFPARTAHLITLIRWMIS